MWRKRPGIPGQGRPGSRQKGRGSRVSAVVTRERPATGPERADIAAAADTAKHTNLTNDRYAQNAIDHDS